jgi:hypothetical protein
MLNGTLRVPPSFPRSCRCRRAAEERARAELAGALLLQRAPAPPTIAEQVVRHPVRLRAELAEIVGQCSTAQGEDAERLGVQRVAALADLERLRTLLVIESARPAQLGAELRHHDEQLVARSHRLLQPGCHVGAEIDDLLEEIEARVPAALLEEQAVDALIAESDRAERRAA